MRDEKDERQLSTLEFRAAMQNASLNHVQSNYKAPELNREILAQVRKQSRLSYKRMAKAAAIVTVILIGGLSIGIWSNADGAYGGKRFINQMIHVSSSLDIKQQVQENGEILESATITDEHNIQAATDLVKTLYVPGYIPEEFAFESLVTEKDDAAEMLNYMYRNADGQKLELVHYNYFTDDDQSVVITGKLYHTGKSGEKVYVETFKNGEYSVVRINNREVSILTGTGNLEEGIKIMVEFCRQ